LGQYRKFIDQKGKYSLVANASDLCT